MDLKILGWTAIAVFLRRDIAVHRARRKPRRCVAVRKRAAAPVAAGMSMET